MYFRRLAPTALKEGKIMVNKPFKAVQKRGPKSYFDLADFNLFDCYMAKVKIRWDASILEDFTTCLNFFGRNLRRIEWPRNLGRAALT